MKNVMVTGANGFIGKHILPLLVSAGFSVTAVASEKANPHSLTAPVQWVRANLLDQREIDSLIGAVRPDALIHLAWVATPGVYWTSLDNFKWAQSSMRLFEQFQAAGGKRIVAAGSCAEYRWENDLCTEYVTPLNYDNPYSACKNALQHLLSSFSKQSGLSSVWGRIFYPYGPYEAPQKLIPHVVLSLLNGKIASCSHGRQIRDYIDVRDVADAMVLLLTSDIEGVVNIGSGKPVVLADFIDKFADALGKRELIRLNAIPSPANEPHSVTADIRRLNEELGWEPKRQMDESVGAVIEWWKLYLKEGKHGF